MAPTGSTLDSAIIMLALANWENRKEIEETELFKGYSEGLAQTHGALKEVGKTGNIDLIVQVEESLLNLENSLYGEGDPSVRPSLNAASVDLSVITKSIGVVRSAEYYQQVDTTIHPKKKIRGVPTDGCHEALNGHITRLGNRMNTVGVTVQEKNVLRQRQANMKTAKKLYIGLQAKALGIELPSKSKGLER